MSLFDDRWARTSDIEITKSAPQPIAPHMKTSASLLKKYFGEIIPPNILACVQNPADDIIISVRNYLFLIHSRVFRANYNGAIDINKSYVILKGI